MIRAPHFDRDRFKTWIDLAEKASKQLTSEDHKEQLKITQLQRALKWAQRLTKEILYK